MIYRISRKIFEILIWIFYRFEVYGRENIPEPPYLIASNHASIADPPLVGIACNRHFIDFMAKKELFDRPFFGRWCRKVGCIEVKRGGNSVRSLKEAIDRLAQGRVVAIFPEGTRSVDGELQEAKRGTGFLIARAKVPVVPVYLEGSAKALPKGGRINRGASIRVFIGKPLMPEEFSRSGSGRDKDYDSISNMIMSRIADIKKSASVSAARSGAKQVSVAQGV